MSLNLHSSMDRFEGQNQACLGKERYIYIPVWIDLKYNVSRDILDGTGIYIPVWIDLKQEGEIEKIKGISIYIPVWIDLKRTG